MLLLVTSVGAVKVTLHEPYHSRIPCFMIVRLTATDFVHSI